MKVNQQRRWKMFVVAGAAMALVAGMVATVPSVYAGGTIKVDDDKWISVGMGTRTSFSMKEDGSGSGGQWSNSFGVDNARIYINGKIHKYVGFEFNTECFNCPRSGQLAGGPNSNTFGSNSNMGLLDAIGKFEIDELVNVWFGRMLVPTERGELNGPFYHAVYDGFRTPLNPADFSTNFGAGGAGMYGRDNGVAFFGRIHPGGTHLQYVAGVYTGTQSNLASLPGGPNQRNSLKYAGRLTWNLLNEEKNPGYYTSGTYYGTAGDILALAVGGEYQNTAAGSALNPAPFGAFVSDILFEKVFSDKGVFTFNAEYKRYWAGNLASFSDASTPGGTGPGSNPFSTFFPIFSGTSFTGYAMYLFPQEVGIGRFQPYGRYTFVNSVHASALDEFEAGVNYVIAGHNARISTWWRHGNIAPTGGPAQTGFNPTGIGAPHQDSFHVALQLQY
ncbi:MAG TPA: hypothetical protein VLL94_11325 [Nitrospiraceae bacterium]|nr:hypothetical protein [Nitrospiraceae bacterium]